MTDRNDFDEDPQLRALVGQADPARSLTPADPQGLARLLEDTMNDAADTSGTTPVRRRGPATWLGAAAAVAVIAGGGFAVASSLGDDDPRDLQAGDPSTPASTTAAEPVVVRLEAPSALAPRCAMPTPEILSQFDTAFSGTVTAIEGDVVTLAPAEVFAGESADEIEVVGASPNLRLALGGQVDFEVGQTYYVSASGGQVSACGYSGSTSDSQLSQIYDLAFR
jgi:hypothetical protein